MILTEMSEPLFRETTPQLRLRETNYHITNPAQLSIIDKLTLRRHKYRHREPKDRNTDKDRILHDAEPSRDRFPEKHKLMAKFDLIIIIIWFFFNFLAAF